MGINLICHFADKDIYVFTKILQFVQDHVGYSIKNKFVTFQIHRMI